MKRSERSDAEIQLSKQVVQTFPKKMLYDALSIGLPDPNAEHVAVLAGYELTKHAKDNSHVDVVKNQLAGFIEAWRSKGV